MFVLLGQNIDIAILSMIMSSRLSKKKPRTFTLRSRYKAHREPRRASGCFKIELSPSYLRTHNLVEQRFDLDVAIFSMPWPRSDEFVPSSPRT